MLEAREIQFAWQRRPVLAGVSLSVAPGERVGLFGRSGEGKSTLGQLLAGHLAPDAGTVTVDGREILSGLHPVQYLHQSPLGAMNPRWRLGRIVAEGWAPDAATRDLLGVSPGWYDRYPHEISGGELQRVAILRALAPGVRYLVCDEITAMLDPVTQVDIWQALMARGLGLLVISHDRALLDRVTTRRVTLESTRLAA